MEFAVVLAAGLVAGTLGGGVVSTAPVTAPVFLARRFVVEIEPAQFRLLMEGLILESGMAMPLAAM